MRFLFSFFILFLGFNNANFSQNFYSEKSKNLTVVYVIPSDLDTIAGYKERIGPVMLYAQNWFRQQMIANGFGDKTFGILKDTILKRVPIYVLRSPNNKTYLNNVVPLTAEVDQFFAANPGLKTSKHVLILLPPFSYTNNDSSRPNAGPFYGYGNYCFAMDCKYVDTIYRGQSTFALWVGGMMHEMGHAFRLPHNNNYFPICGDFTKSPAFNFANYPTYRPSLMAIGNYTLEMYPTVLTKADCAMLNVNEIFNNDNIAYYENANSGLYTLHGVFKESSGVMEISGRYFNRPVTGNEISPIDDIVIYHDPNYNNEGFGGNRDYNALSWAIKPIGNDSFHINIPIQQLQFQNNTPYEIKIKLIHRNGKIKQTVAYFEFRNGRPNLRYHIRYDYAAISRNGWTINSSTSHPGLPASNLIDTNITSFWHSNYQTSPPASYPHTIDINLGQQKTLVGFGYTQRDDIARAIKDIRISVSTNGTDFSEIGNYILKKEEGLDFLSFPTPKTFQYFRLTALSSWDGFPFAALGELNLFETRAVNLPCSCD